MTIQSSHVFISYARSESQFVDKLEKDLNNKGLPTWVDRHMLIGGQEWLDTIQDAIEDCQSLILVMTTKSLESDYVRMEYRYARRIGKPVIPLLVESSSHIPMDLYEIQWIHFQGEYLTAFNNLLIALKFDNRVNSFTPIDTSSLSTIDEEDTPALHPEEYSHITLSREVSNTIDDIFKNISLERMQEMNIREFDNLISYMFQRAGYIVRRDPNLESIDFILYEHDKPIEPKAYVVTKRISKGVRVNPSQVLSLIGTVATKRISHLSAYFITTSDFSMTAYEAGLQDKQIYLVNGERLIRYIRYINGSRYPGLKMPSIPIDVIFHGDSIKKVLPSQTKILTIAQPSGGVGRTTTAIYLAVGLARLGQHVLLGDMDIKAGLTQSLNQYQRTNLSKKTFADYFLGKSELATIISSTIHDNLWLLPSHEREMVALEKFTNYETELAFVKDLHATIAASANFDWVIFDTSSSLSIFTRASLAASHYILAPIIASPFAFSSINYLFECVSGMQALSGKGVNLLGFFMTSWQDKVLNRAYQNNLADFLPSQRQHLFTAIPLDSRVSKVGEIIGRSGQKSLYDYFTPGVNAYSNLVKEVLYLTDEG